MDMRKKFVMKSKPSEFQEHLKIDLNMHREFLHLGTEAIDLNIAVNSRGGK